MEEAPPVVICGGLLTSPFLYRPLAARLRARGARTVTIAPIHTLAWLPAAWVGFGPLAARVRRCLVETHRHEGRPLLVVGHSAGGLLARLALTFAADGAEPGSATIVGALVTLGTPHRVPHETPRQRAGFRASRYLESVTPGAWFAPRTGYLTVASRAVPARARWRAGRERRFAGTTYASLLGPDGWSASGDGIVPEVSAHLDGARQITLDDVRHGTFGPNWYGAETVVDRWWPAALEVWRGALAARGQGGRVGAFVSPPGRAQPDRADFPPTVNNMDRPRLL